MPARAARLLLIALLAGCATPEPVRETPALPAPVEPPAAAKPQLESQPLRHLANRKLAPIPDRPLNVRTRCNFRDPTGYRGSLDLQVKNSDVQRLVAEINIPKQGVCRFDKKDFLQADKTRAVLAPPGADDLCKVRIWEQDSHFTVAFRDCRTRCSGESFDYLWPILVDAKSGKCS
jgi:hypothetical protein